jgi:WD40 repeat protein
MKNKIFRALTVAGALLLPARNGPAESFGYTFESRWSVPGGAVHRLAFSPDGHWLAAAVGSRAKVFEIAADGTARDSGTVSLGRPEITGLAFSPDGKSIAVVDESGTLSLFESASLQSLIRVEKAHSGRASCVTFTGDGSYVVTGGRDGKVKVWTPRGEFFAELSRGVHHEGEILMVGGLAGGRQVISVGQDHQVILWQVDTQQAIRPISVEKRNDIRAAAVGGDGKTMALSFQLLSGNRFRSAPRGSLNQEIKADNTLRLIDTQSGTQLRDILGEEQDLNAVGVTPDGRFVAAGGSGRSASIWDTATGQRINAIPSEAPLTAISFAPDGKRLALGARNGSLSLYHLSGVGPALPPKPTSTVVIVILQPSGLVDDDDTHRGEVTKVRSPTLRLQGEIKTAAPIKSLLVDGTEITSIQPSGPGNYRFNAYVRMTEPGQHRFQVVAENVEGTLTRQSFTVERASDADLHPGFSSPGRRMALIVGISRYAKPTINLKYAADDAHALYDLLTNPALGPAAFHPKDVKLLLDEQATGQAINTGLRDFLQKARENDFVLFFFAGHGAPDPNRLLDLYLLAHDTDPDNIAGTGLLMEHVRESISQIPARDVLVLTDACHGAALGGIAGMRGVKENPIHQVFLEKLIHASGGLAILTASEAAQASYENERWGNHGVFTYFLLQGLRGDADADHDGIVSLDEIIEYVRERVKTATESRQIPAVGPTSFDRQLPLSIVIPQNPANHSSPPGR